ncbi:AAA family ATPase [Nonomuraea angiospora]|uniref:AAA family ATPase n=1 Tax=Nonomuraea angiospora TaxID=46172 RepID=UPI00340466C6
MPSGRKGGKRRQTVVRRSAAKPAAPTPADLVAQSEAAADDLGGETTLPPAEAAPQEIDAAVLQTAWQRFEQAKNAYESLTEAVEEKQHSLSVQEAELTHRARDVQDRETVLEARTQALDKRDAALLEGEKELNTRLAREKEILLADARRELDDVLKGVQAERAELEAQRERARAELMEELARERQELADEKDTLRRERRSQRELKAKIDAQTEDLADIKAMYEERMRLAVSSATEVLQQRYEHARRMHEQARQDAQRLENELEQRARADRAFGNRLPDEVLAELEDLKKDNAELRRSRSTIPDDALDRLRLLETEQRHWREDRAILRAENERLQRQLAGLQMSTVELERLKVSKEAAEATVKAYRATVEELKQQMGELTERKESDTPFPQCSAMDAAHSEPPVHLVEDLPPLPELVAYVRAYIRQQYDLFYEERDLRCFMAGLAASRLHLLQGISGIGKTELPQRFAEALGATSAVVSVGADWRTPQDLMGYYNAFERKFYEYEFTQALYRALCPQYAAQPFIVVLDEMNLSHPEQYFNDVLSALALREKADGSSQNLVLMSAAVEPAPRHLREGRMLPLPPNVWFVGTANHDETTVPFADKTYDRAHVLELPPRHEHFPAKPVEPLGPVSLKALHAAFSKARRGNDVHKQMQKAYQFFEGEFLDFMVQEFKVAWGSRLKSQLSAFVPVVLGSGGSMGEALDHVVTTKILRKLRGRYEIQVPKLENLRDELLGMWKLVDDGEPTTAVRLISEEIYLRGQA